MNVENILLKRANDKCELCTGRDELEQFSVPGLADDLDGRLILCLSCRDQLKMEKLDINHWHCLGESMWSQHRAVQVMVYRLLFRLENHALLDQLYLDEETLSLAKAGLPQINNDSVGAMDSNGSRLMAGDAVTLIKDLDVKGANFTAKRGTIVRNISLSDDANYIEGKVNGTQVVLVAKFVKKAKS